MKEEFSKTLSLVSDIFTDHGIRHSFIKMLADPFDMTDIDVLIPYASDELDAINLLKSEGFKSRRAGRLLHPLKVICAQNHGPAIDIHPDAEWNYTKVADGRKMVASSIPSNIRGVEVNTPSPEDSFYLIATHAFIQHQEIKITEVLNAIPMISKSNFSWRKVSSMAKDFGTLGAIYAFLLAINVESDIEESILEKFSSPLSGFIDNQIRECSSFPINFPSWLVCGLFSIVHLTRINRRIKSKELAFDFLSHYMRWIGRSGKNLQGLSRLVPQTLGGPGRNIYNMFFERYFGRRGYIDRLIEKYKCKRIMEIGVHDGENAKEMISTARSIHKKVEYYGFDLFNKPRPEGEFKDETGGYSLKDIKAKLQETGGKICLYEGNTRRTLPKFVDGLPKMDFILIDGGHSVETVKSDWENVQQLMHEGTIVIFDNYELPDPKEVVGSLVKGYNVEIFSPPRKSEVMAKVRIQ